MTITLTEDADGVLDDYSEYLYTSPTAQDEEGDTIEMAFSGLEGLSFANVKHNSDDSFTLKLNRELIDSSGSYSLTVKLGDVVNPASSGKGHTIQITINYNDYEEPVEDEYDYYEDQSTDSTEAIEGEVEEELTTEEKLDKIAKDKASKAKAEQAKRLNAGGFVRTPGLGFTFPGVSVAKMEDTEEVEKVVPPDPQMRINSITALGEMQIDFN